MGLMRINGGTVVPPKEFSVGYQTIDSENSGRNADGNMVRDIITEKVKLQCNWAPLSDSEISNLLRLMDQSFFTIEYPDAKVGGQATKTFYAGDRTAPTYSWNEEFKEIKWEGLSVNFIEK